MQHKERGHDLQEVISQRSELTLTLRQTILERDQLKVEAGQKSEEAGLLKTEVSELKTTLEDLKHVQGKNTALEEQLSSLNSLLMNRVTKHCITFTQWGHLVLLTLNMICICIFVRKT